MDQPTGLLSDMEFMLGLAVGWISFCVTDEYR